MKRIITITLLCIIMAILVLIEGCLDTLERNSNKEYDKKIEQLNLLEDDAFFENWKYIYNIADNDKERESLTTTRKELEEDLRKNYKFEKCKITNVTNYNNVIRFDIKLDDYHIYVKIEKENKSDYKYSYTAHERK